MIAAASAAIIRNACPSTVREGDRYLRLHAGGWQPHHRLQELVGQGRESRVPAQGCGRRLQDVLGGADAQEQLTAPRPSASGQRSLQEVRRLGRRFYID